MNMFSARAMHCMIQSVMRRPTGWWHSLTFYGNHGNVIQPSLFMGSKLSLVRLYAKKSLKKYKGSKGVESGSGGDDHDHDHDDEEDDHGGGQGGQGGKGRDREANSRHLGQPAASSPANMYHFVSSPRTIDDYDFEAVRQEMEKSFKTGQIEFVQAFQWTSGHFTSNVLDSIMVLDDSTTVGTTMRRPLNTLASIHAKDAQTLVLRSHDPLYMRAIEKALRLAASSSLVSESCLTFHRESDSVLLVALPKLDASMRAQLVKQGAKYFESMKCKVRDTRRDALAHLDSIAEDDRLAIRKKVQSIHDAFIRKIDDFAEAKKKEWQKS